MKGQLLMMRLPLSEELAKEHIGNFIYNYVVEAVGELLAPKYTGVLLSVPMHEKIQLLHDYDWLLSMISKVRSALQ